MLTTSTRVPFAIAFWRTATPLDSSPFADVGRVYEICSGRPWLAAQSSTIFVALLRRSMPSVRVSERPSTSKSRRDTSYVVITFSSALAIAFTSLQESASSVPPWSALQPPKDGITSPPIARSDWMSET